MTRPVSGVGRGGKAVPLERKRLRGSEIRNAPKAGPTPGKGLSTVKLGVVPVAPDGFGVTGVAWWGKLWGSGRRWLDDDQDGVLIGMVCRHLEDVVRLEMWLGDDVERRWYEGKNGQIVSHPAVKQIFEMRAQIAGWLSLLGFTPSDRARMGLAEIRVADALETFRQRQVQDVVQDVVQEADYVDSGS